MSDNTHNYESSLIERAIFNNRLIIIVLSLLITVFLAYRASFVTPDTRLDRLVPSSHEFVLQAKEFLAGDPSGGGQLPAGRGITQSRHYL